MGAGFDRPPTMKGTVKEVDHSGRRLLGRSMASPTRQTRGGYPLTGEDLDDISEESMDAVVGSPMLVFLPGAPLGSVTSHKLLGRIPTIRLLSSGSTLFAGPQKSAIARLFVSHSRVVHIDS